MMQATRIATIATEYGSWTQYWHKQEPFVILRLQPWPWDETPCVALVKEGPKAIAVCAKNQHAGGMGRRK